VVAGDGVAGPEPEGRDGEQGQLAGGKPCEDPVGAVDVGRDPCPARPSVPRTAGHAIAASAPWATL
jgi:hypothetical protein